MKLRPYQETSRDFLASRRIALLADEMRVGKTPAAIAAAEKIGAERTLVVAPAIAVPIWRSQFPRWWRESPPVAVLSFEKALIHAAEIKTEPWALVIVDECHFAGNPEAKRTKLIYGKDGLAHVSKRLWALSGTPAPKHAGSLWPILRTAGVVKADYTTFLRHFCRIDYLSQRPIGTREDRIEELRALWLQIGLRRTRAEVAPDMPDVDYEFLEVEPTENVDLPNPGPMSDEALLDGLQRYANDNREDRVAVAMSKVGPLVDEIEFSIANKLIEQTVVFGWHLEPLRKVVSCLNAMGIKAKLLAGETSAAERVRIQEELALGVLDVVVGQIRACGTAIDLSAARHGYFLELDWVPDNNKQAASRLVSLEKQDKVTMDVCTRPGSVDERVQKVLLQRARESGKLFGPVQENA